MLVLIYVLMVGWFRSFLTPLIVMVAIPFSLVGILPAHGLLGAFFSATSMIGFMAGAGIVVRNSIILVDFIEQRLAEGMPLAEAVVDAGAVRFRPMLLTALAVVVGASVILADPIFQGLAIALMAGEIASLLISRMAVPVLYFMANNRGAPCITTATHAHHEEMSDASRVIARKNQAERTVFSSGRRYAFDDQPSDAEGAHRLCVGVWRFFSWDRLPRDDGILRP